MQAMNAYIKLLNIKGGSMLNNLEFIELCLVIDSREQSDVFGKPRVKRITDWFVAHGGLVSH